MVSDIPKMSDLDGRFHVKRDKDDDEWEPVPWPTSGAAIDYLRSLLNGKGLVRTMAKETFYVDGLDGEPYFVHTIRFPDGKKWNTKKGWH